jgi:DNA-binding protein H-NS
VEIDKQQIIQMLRDQGDHEKAQQAEQQLPDKVDHEQHQDLLQQFGINPQDLISKL